MRLCFTVFFTLVIIILIAWIALKMFYPFPAASLVSFPMPICHQSQETLEELRTSSQEILKRSKETAKLYHLAPGETLKDITALLLTHPNTSNAVKMAITEKHHRYYVFTYPSDDLIIKGYISLPTDTSHPFAEGIWHPTIYWAANIASRYFE